MRARVMADSGTKVVRPELFAEALRRRTKAFAFSILKLCRTLPQTDEGRVISRQLLRCGMSVGANYRAVTRSRSNAEFIAKVGIVIEEADETLFWLEALSETGICNSEPIQPLAREGKELLSVLVAAQRTARTRRRERASKPRTAIRTSQLG